MLRWLAVPLVALALTACGFGGAARPSPPGTQFPPHARGTSGPNPSSGMSVYEANCSTCHGAAAQGGVTMAPGVISPDIRWSKLSALHPPYTDALLRRAILDGLAANGDPLNAHMPRWRGRLSTDQVSAVIGYLHTLH